MGSSNSNGRDSGRVQGSMFITLESKRVMPGGTLKGVVHVSLSEGIVSSSLCLTFKGIEETNFLYGNNYKIADSSPLCNLKLILYEHQETILPGNFSFPFQLKIDDALLPNFKFTSRGILARISYSLCAELYGSQKLPLAFELPVYLFTKSITLPPELFPTALEKQFSYESHVFFCFKRESAKARVWIERGVLSRPDNIDINIEVNFSNNFSVDEIQISFWVKKVLNISAKLLLEIGDDGSECPPDYRSTTSSITEFNADINYKIQKGTERQLFNYQIPVQYILQNVSNDICYSMASKLIKCQYVLSIRLSSASPSYWKCYNIEESNQPFVILPFKIEVPIIPPPIAPEQWQAQVLIQNRPNAGNQNLENPNTQIVIAEAISDREADALIR